jgi:hypothetical protein
MAIISRARACLRFWGDELNLEELTASLGRAPSSSQIKGQAIKGKVTGQVRIAKTGGWSFKVEAREPGDLNAQIQELFGSLTADLSIWRELAARYSCDLFVGTVYERAKRSRRDQRRVSRPFVLTRRVSHSGYIRPGG